MMTRRQRTITRIVGCTGAAAAGYHQVLAELAHPHAPPGSWITAGLVAWILNSDGMTRRLRGLLLAGRGYPGEDCAAADPGPAPRDGPGGAAGASLRDEA